MSGVDIAKAKRFLESRGYKISHPKDLKESKLSEAYFGEPDHIDKKTGRSYNDNPKDWKDKFAKVEDLIKEYDGIELGSRSSWNCIIQYDTKPWTPIYKFDFWEDEKSIDDQIEEARNRIQYHCDINGDVIGDQETVHESLKKSIREAFRAYGYSNKYQGTIDITPMAICKSFPEKAMDNIRRITAKDIGEPISYDFQDGRLVAICPVHGSLTVEYGFDAGPHTTNAKQHDEQEAILKQKKQDFLKMFDDAGWIVE